MSNMVSNIAGRALGPVFSAVSAVGQFYTEINPATLSGAIDIIVVESATGTLACSPFHVRFGKLKLLRPQDKVVEIVVNDCAVDTQMKVGEQGESFFVVESRDPVPSGYATSPITKATSPPIDETFTNQEFKLVDGFVVDHALVDKPLLDKSLVDGKIVSHEFVGSKIVDKLPVDHALVDKSLVDGKIVSHEFVGSKIVDKLPVGHALVDKLPVDHALVDKSLVDHTLDLGDLHIGSDYTDNDLRNKSLDIPPAITKTGPTDAERLDTRVRFDQDETSSISIQGRGIKYSVPAASSPPWIWKWGGLPEKSSEDLFHENQTVGLNKQKSCPVMKQPTLSRDSLQPNRVLSSIHSSIAEDTVDTQLTAINSISIDKHYPIELEQDKENMDLLHGVSSSDQTIVLISQCGPLLEFQKLSLLEADKKFCSKAVSFEMFCEHPELLVNPCIIFKVDGFYHAWNTAAPIILSRVLYQKSLTTEAIAQVLKTNPKGSPSWSWWRSAPKVGTKAQIKDSLDKTNNESSPSKVTPQPKSIGPFVSNQKTNRFAKSLRMTSDQLKSLDLKYGANTIQFSVTSGFQGRAFCSAKIYLWRHDAKIVISDVDGTITKSFILIRSDVLGHVFTMVGKDWTHSGVASFYSNISKNGYHFLYLTSRAIGQAESTRDYLSGIEQDKRQLPDGPILLSPDRLIRALTREVIHRRPQEFKIQCLKDVKRLFSPNAPFYAGFGNRITDAMSYRSVDIPSSRIFTIDSSGEVKLELLVNFKTSYVKLNETVDQIFPPFKTLCAEFVDFQYWRSRLPDVRISFGEVDASDSKSDSNDSCSSSVSDFQNNDDFLRNPKIASGDKIIDDISPYIKEIGDAIDADQASI